MPNESVRNPAVYGGSIKVHHVLAFTKGWLIGDFEPAMLRTKDFEVGVHHYTKGQKCAPHIHDVATEYNVVVRGEMRVTHPGGSGRNSVWLMVREGGIFVVEPGEAVMAEFLTDVDLVVIKVPSVPGDKREVKP